MERIDDVLILLNELVVSRMNEMLQVDTEYGLIAEDLLLVDDEFPDIFLNRMLCVMIDPLMDIFSVLSNGGGDVGIRLVHVCSRYYYTIGLVLI